MDDDRTRLLAQHGVELVIDAGANAGQYALNLRKNGYSGAIVSFEPLSEAFEQLCVQVHRDPGWSAHHLALGEVDGPATINVAANSFSSSFLDVTPTHLDAAPEAAFCGREEVEMRRLDSLPPAWFAPGARLLKVDAQGFEPMVLRGARRFLRDVALVELEMSIIPIYDGQDLAHDVLALMRDLDFRPVALESSFAHPVTGEIQCIDVIFARSESGSEPERGTWCQLRGRAFRANRRD